MAGGGGGAGVQPIENILTSKEKMTKVEREGDSVFILHKYGQNLI